MTRAPEHYDDADGEEDHGQHEDGPSPPRSVVLRGFTPDISAPVPDVSDGQEAGDKESDHARIAVIQHKDDGACCSLPETPVRDRMGARSDPGRPILDRALGICERRPGRVLPGRLAQDGDVIRYFSKTIVDENQEENEEWLQATVRPMFLTQQRLYPTYYNILNELGEELSVELLVGVNWQKLRGEEWVFVDDGERRPA